VRGEAAADAGLEGELAQSGAGRADVPGPAEGGAVDDAEQRAGRQGGAAGKPGAKLLPAPVVDAGFAAFAALAAPYQQRPTAHIQVGLRQVERFADPQPGAPEDHDQAAQAVAVSAGTGLSHNRDDLFDSGGSAG
jgi:hypothetical protein